MSLADYKIADKAFNVSGRLGDIFSTKKNYSLGEYCIYQNKIYKFIDNKIAGAWDNDVVEETTIEKEFKKIKNSVRPIGSIYMSTVDTDPSILFGGTWKQIKDRFLFAENDTHIAGTTGGESNVTLTVNNLPSHNHTYNLRSSSGGGDSTSSGGRMDVLQTSASNRTSGGSGGNASHNNMPPYLVVYMWERIA